MSFLVSTNLAPRKVFGENRSFRSSSLLTLWFSESPVVTESSMISESQNCSAGNMLSIAISGEEFSRSSSSKKSIEAFCNFLGFVVDNFVADLVRFSAKKLVKLMCCVIIGSSEGINKLLSSFEWVDCLGIDFEAIFSGLIGFIEFFFNF